MPLYLNNQQDLYHNVSVIHSFLGLAIGVPFLALPIYFVALRSRALAGVVWFYYFAGFAFLGVVTIHGWEAELTVKVAATVTVAVVFILLQFVANRWWDLRRASAYFALFAVVFVATDVFEFATRYVELPDELQAPSSSVGFTADRSGDQPNFYHLVLDEYQTDVFEFVLDSELRESLGGFVFFSDTTTPFGRTGMALASLFGGRSFDFASPQIDYQLSAFAGPQSMLTEVVNAGYETEAYLHERMFSFELPFHRIRYHQAPIGYRSDSSRLFRQIWVYANFPRFVSGRFIDSDSFDNFDSQNVLDASSTVKSLHTFRYVTRREASQRGTGRYVFAHILLPHFPTVLEADCSYAPDESRTGAAPQARCTNALLMGFLSTLKDLGRFRDSLIVIQADHGSRYAVRDGRLQPLPGLMDYGLDWNAARSRALLLVKLPGRGEEQPLETRSDPTSLLDVFPTVAAALGLDAGSAEGVDLFDPYATAALSERQRWYYFFMKKERSGWTDEMVRFRVEPGRVVRDGVETLRNNPRR